MPFCSLDVRKVAGSIPVPSTFETPAAQALEDIGTLARGCLFHVLGDKMGESVFRPFLCSSLQYPVER